MSEGMRQAEAMQKKQKEAQEADERDIEANKKCAIAIKNIIKIK